MVHALHKKHGERSNRLDYPRRVTEPQAKPMIHYDNLSSHPILSVQTIGPFVRLAPDHISISAPAAIPLVYGHGNGFLKADFYDAFVSIRRGLFNTRDRTEHGRKRKIVSHVFSQVSSRAVGSGTSIGQGSFKFPNILLVERIPDPGMDRKTCSSSRRTSNPSSRTCSASGITCAPTRDKKRERRVLIFSIVRYSLLILFLLVVTIGV